MSDREETEKSIKQLTDIINQMMPKKEESGGIEDILKQILDGKKSEASPPSNEALSNEETAKILKQFVDESCSHEFLAKFQKGDVVEPTEAGKIRYGIRPETMLMISDVFYPDVRGDKDNDMVHGEIIHYDHKRKHVIPHIIDFRFFKVTKKAGGKNEETKSS